MEADPIDWKLTTANNTINIIIVGRVGNGKSATGNSILGWEAFFSDDSLSAVTCSSELQRTILNDGRIINVIDTPGLFDFSTSAEVISGEIVKCINLAKDGIHAVLMVFSLRSRFSIEEVVAVESMKSLFGDKIVDYMILVFTNGDILESKKKSLKDFISLSPEPLRNIIQLFKNRVIVLDNTTKDMIKREEQVSELLSLVESVVVDNGEKPYSNKIFVELKEGALLRHQKVKEVEAKEGCSKEELYELMKEKHVTEIVDEKVKLSMERIWEQQVEERVARLEAEERAARLEAERLDQESLKDEIRKLKEDLNDIRKQYEEYRKRKAKGQICVIL